MGGKSAVTAFDALSVFGLYGNAPLWAADDRVMIAHCGKIYLINVVPKGGYPLFI